MTKAYIATNKDLDTISEALKYVWHPQLKFIFRDSSRIEKTVLISYDSNSIYLWSAKELGKLKQIDYINKRYHFYQIPHSLKIKDEWQYAWCAGIWDKKIENLLPNSIKESSEFEIPRISGSLLAPFINLQKRFKGKENNPYITKEGYLATIIHEFAHVYWNSFKLWWPSNKKENVSYLNLARKNLSQDKKALSKPLRFPTIEAFGEVFAFCTENRASNMFFPAHKKSLESFGRLWLEHLIREERDKDLEKEDSTIEPTKFQHSFAFVFGRIILNKYPKNWPEILTNPTILSPHL